MSVEKLLQKHEKEIFLGRVDSLFLSVSSLVSMIFSVIEIVVGDVTSLSYVLPLLFGLYGIPVWIGYFRGALIYDLIAERIRGFWKIWTENVS